MVDVILQYVEQLLDLSYWYFKDVASEFITAISDADIANVEIGDLVKFDPAEDYTRFSIYPRTRIKEIRYATDNNTIVLNRRLEVDATFTVKVIVYKNEEFVITNNKGQTGFFYDTCNSELEIGNQARRLDIGRVYPDVETPSTTVSSYDNITSDVRVYSYWVDPLTINAGGPTTTLNADAANGPIAGSTYLTVAELGTDNGRFAVDDLIIVGATSDISQNGLTGNNWEIMKIAAVDAPSNTLRCLPGQEGTNNQGLSVYPASTTSVIRILKHPESSGLYDIDLRSRSGTGSFVSAIISDGHIVQQKLDYPNWVRFVDVKTIVKMNGSLLMVDCLVKYHSDNNE